MEEPYAHGRVPCTQSCIFDTELARTTDAIAPILVRTVAAPRQSLRCLENRHPSVASKPARPRGNRGPAMWRCRQTLLYDVIRIWHLIWHIMKVGQNTSFRTQLPNLSCGGRAFTGEVAVTRASCTGAFPEMKFFISSSGGADTSGIGFGVESVRVLLLVPPDAEAGLYAWLSSDLECRRRSFVGNSGTFSSSSSSLIFGLEGSVSSGHRSGSARADLTMYELAWYAGSRDMTRGP